MNRIRSITVCLMSVGTLLVLAMNYGTPDTKKHIYLSGRRDPDGVFRLFRTENFPSQSEVAAPKPVKLAKSTAKASRKRRANVLFIIADDLRPQLGVYRDPDAANYFSKLRIQTPNLDRLASRSLVFKHAYAQYSLCGPSRTSLLTSRRPDATHVYSNRVYWRDVGGNFTTLPQHFKDNGYLTVGLGKVFHPKLSSNGDDPPSWTEPYHRSKRNDRFFLVEGGLGPWHPVTDEELGAERLVDNRTTFLAKALLRNLTARQSSRPFFMAVGYHKPHKNWVCPKRFHDVYPLEDEDQFLANRSWQSFPIPQSLHLKETLVAETDGILTSDILRLIRRLYFACISYVDALVGELLGELEELGLADDTVVSFMADHGFHLGENGHWGKTSTWEISNRIPLMIRVPGLTDAGLVTESLVEALDVFPTLVEAAGLDPVPPCQDGGADVRLCTQGVSLMPLFENPDYVLRDAALSQIQQAPYMGYSLRTRPFKLAERLLIHNTASSDPKHQRCVQWPPVPNATELYDHSKDKLEQFNLAHDPRYQNVVRELRK